MKKLLLLVAAGLIPAAHLAARDSGLQPFRIGGYEVYVLTESSSPSNVNILIDAPQAVLDKYAPDGTVPSAVNAVLIKGDGKVWLVDTGLGQKIFALMAAAGVAPEEVGCVCLTHMHGDHTGGMLRDGKPAFPNAEVMLSRREYTYWASREEMEKMPERARGNFTSAQKIFDVYADRLTLLDPKEIGDEMENGIIPVAAYGHTPGHTMFMIKHRMDELLIWGDITHAMAVQMPHPEISVRYDADPDMARASRQSVLRYLTADPDRGPYVIGMHVPSTVPGTVSVDKTTGGYAFDAVE